MFLKKKQKADFLDQVSRRSTVIPISDKKQGLDFLVSLFSSIRPSSAPGKSDARANLERMTGELQLHPVLLNNLQHAILSQLAHTDLSTALTESGIPLARGFWGELFGRLRHKVLPPLQSEDDFLYALNHIFYRRNDFLWVEKIPVDSWVRFFDTVGLSMHLDDQGIIAQVLAALKILVFQVAQLGLEKEVWQYVSEEDRLDNPFVALNYLVHELEEGYRRGIDKPAIRETALRINARSAQGLESIEYIRARHGSRGASLHQTYTLVILAQKLERIGILVDILDQDKEMDTERFAGLFSTLIRNENRKNSIREFLSECIGYLAYQIAEHKGSKGNAYITTGWPEYLAMIRSAMKGGGIICFVAVIKNLLTAAAMPVFWHGFAYSMNYSLGFVVIEETHSTLATKQPAFTASALAETLDTKKTNHRPNLYTLAITVAKVSRSQVASFLGNLLVVFPGTYLLAWLYHQIMGTKILEGEAARAMLENQHPWHSLSLLYACNAGFFLFLSGIIAGYVQNKVQYGHIGKRLVQHPLLAYSFSAEQLKRLADYLEKHAGAIIGNIALGFFLGMVVIIPSVFGIPFDIRHITISAGNTAIAVYGLGLGESSPGYLLTILIGVLGIGFFNFLISFSLAFMVAVRSRGIRLREYPEFMGILIRYLFRKPLNFIRPPRTPAGQTE